MFRQVPALMVFLFAFLNLSHGQNLPDGFYDQAYLTQFDFPTVITFDATGRMYVAEKEGKVYIVDSSGQVFPEPLIDISEEVANWKDHGLMGFALDNSFRYNGYFYLLYALDLHYYDYYGTPSYNPDTTVTNYPTIGRVARYQADPTTGFTHIVPNSRKILLGETIDNGIPLLYEFHGLGTLLMGEDGTLLISCGDATSNAGPDTGGDSLGTMITPALARGIITPDQDVGSYRAMYLHNYNGKILRIDADTGDGLPSNPFFDPARPRSPQSRIWAWGLRNPYRFTLRPNSGSHSPEDGRPGVLYVGDVGNGAWEELNVVETGGQNFGWPILEGIGSHWPYIEVPAPKNRMAPNPLNGEGCEEDYFTFKELFVSLERDSTPAPRNPCDTSQAIDNFVVGYPPAIQWTNSRWNLPTRTWIPFFNDRGQLNGAELGSGQTSVTGTMFDGYSSLGGVFYTGSQFPTQYQGKFFSVDFNHWIRIMEFDEYNVLHAVEPFHTYAKDVIHLALNPATGALFYINLEGQIRQITFGGNPPPVAVINDGQFYGPSPLNVQFDGSHSTDDLGPVASYYWDFGDGQSSTEKAPGHTYTASGSGPQSFTVQLVVTDSLGATAKTEAIVSLNNTPPQVQITSFRDGDRYPLHQGTTLLRLAAEVKDAEHPDDELLYQWRTFVQHNDHFHPDPVDFEPETFTLISPLGCDGELYWYRIQLTVTDPAGLSATRTQSVYPNCDGPFISTMGLEATPDEGLVHLTWTASFEDSLEYFEVQRGYDNFHFTPLGTLPPNAEQEGLAYQFDDTDPIHGLNIYRIKAHHLNGAYLFSKAVEVSYPRPRPIRLYPNPVQDELTIAVHQAEAPLVELELYDELGRSMLKQSWPAEMDQPFSVTADTRLLKNGLYHYRIVNGELRKVGKLVVAR
ncbi:MAG: PQQ-dependent sugar dehydrogenase [Lewinellaceae bacterium]|nr:PQQ-dependent sugar dehydrogenase [Lewinellaceae bacterium]